MVFSSLRDAFFSSVHKSNIVYNTCWEDPRIDRQVLDLNENDHLLVLTSAGCNALDYLLAGTGKVYCVDMNLHQNALLELKIAALKSLSYDQFFSMFGKGVLDSHLDVYKNNIRPNLKLEYIPIWDKHINLFSGKGWQGSFYFRGTSGLFAKLVNYYINSRFGLRASLKRMFETNDLEEQRNIYLKKVKPKFWSKPLKWALNRDVTLTMLGVPHSQRLQIENYYQGGVVKFIEDCIDAVFGRLALKDNYFWRLYVFGEYTDTCCPEYLKSENFVRLKELVKDRISTHTCTVTEFLNQKISPISKFVLLDHMDWLSAHKMEDLKSEWQAIVDNATSGARCIWRSGGVKVEFIDDIKVNYKGENVAMSTLLKYNQELAANLHELDRVHTYGSFYIADLP